MLFWLIEVSTSKKQLVCTVQRSRFPPFIKGKKQLSKMEVDTARRLPSVRIHVEHVIGVIRQKYTILQSTPPINMIMCGEDSELSAIDKMVTVACTLCNHCDSVIPFD